MRCVDEKSLFDTYFLSFFPGMGWGWFTKNGAERKRTGLESSSCKRQSMGSVQYWSIIRPRIGRAGTELRLIQRVVLQSDGSEVCSSSLQPGNGDFG